MAVPEGATLITKPSDVARLVVSLRKAAGMSKLALARTAQVARGTIDNVEDEVRDKVITTLVPVLAVLGKGIAIVDLPPAGEESPGTATPPATPGTPEA